MAIYQKWNYLWHHIPSGTKGNGITEKNMTVEEFYKLINEWNHASQLSNSGFVYWS